MSTMKRSRINALIRDAEAFLAQHHFLLPPFARWTPADWQAKGPEVAEIVDRALGWDVTDFGSGDFDRDGLLLFTMRNGDPAALREGTGKIYAEKMLIVGVDQRTPMHFHFQKSEDIINRGGGTLVVRVYNADESDGLGSDPVTLSTDGVERTVDAGTLIRLGPGESITLTPRLYHEFWAEGSRVLAGEVSVVNDDSGDNRFFKEAQRYMQVEEDEEPLYPLCNEVSRFYAAT